jgi:hypothetical protein
MTDAAQIPEEPAQQANRFSAFVRRIKEKIVPAPRSSITTIPLVIYNPTNSFPYAACFARCEL